MWSKNQWYWSIEGGSLRDCGWRMGYLKHRLWKGSVNGNGKNKVRVGRGWVGKVSGDETTEKLRGKGPEGIIYMKTEINKCCRVRKRKRKGMKR